MKKMLYIAAALTIAGLAAGCGSGQPDNSSPEAFLRDFVKSLAEEQTERFALFYLQESDFDPEAPASDLAKERFMGTVREVYLERCRGAADFMRGEKVIVDKIQFRKFDPRVVQFLGNVKENHSGTLVRLAIGAQKARIEVDELIQVGESWRLTQILLIVEEETEWGGEIELDASKSKITEGKVITEDEEEEDEEEKQDEEK